MAIDPVRTPGGRIIQLHEQAQKRRPADPGRSAVSESARISSGATTTEGPDSVVAAPEALNVRKALVLARIQRDFYNQAHVRERVIDSLLQFLDEE